MTPLACLGSHATFFLHETAVINKTKLFCGSFHLSINTFKEMQTFKRAVTIYLLFKTWRLKDCVSQCLDFIISYRGLTSEHHIIMFIVRLVCSMHNHITYTVNIG